MRRILQHRPSPAMVVSLIALAVALGGTSYAAVALPRNSVGPAQLKAKAVTRPKIANNAITSIKVLNGSLKKEDFAANQLAAGVQGPPGPQGPSGPAGANGTNGTNGATNVVARRGASMNVLPAGTLLTAACGAGERATGGGMIATSNHLDVVDSQPMAGATPAQDGQTPTGWSVHAKTDNGLSYSAQPVVICASP
jgi:hypothetical protein